MSRKSRTQLSDAEHAFIKQVAAFSCSLMEHGQSLGRGRGNREKFEHDLFLYLLQRLIKYVRKQHPELFKGIKEEKENDGAKEKQDAEGLGAR